MRERERERERQGERAREYRYIHSQPETENIIKLESHFLAKLKQCTLF